MNTCKMTLQTIKAWPNRLLFALPVLAFLLFSSPALHAQATATVTGSVTDPKGAVIVGASVTILNQETQDLRAVKSNKDGLFVIPNLLPSTYTVKVVAPGFTPKELTDINLHAGDEITLPPLDLTIGAVTDTVVVEVAPQILTTANGERTELLTYQDIQDIALEGRDTTELLKVLPGVVTITSNGVPTASYLDVTAGQSAIGQGLNSNGAANRGGTTIMIDGVSVLDPGADFSSLVTLNPEMTQEVSVLSTNFDAATPFGPVVISSISRSGGAKYHGEAYYDIRNDALNANDWQDNHTIPVHAKAGAHYYYPGGSISGPVPHTNKKLLFFGGFELLYQDQGNANILKGYIPSKEMLAGNFSTDNADNNVLCPYGFFNTNQNTSNSTTSTAFGGWCQNITTSNGNAYATVLPDGTNPTIATSSVATAPAGVTQGFAGGYIPAKYINPNSIALSTLWPAPTATTLAQIQANGGYNYYQPIINHDNGWIYRGRLDYNLSENDKFYIAYQQGYDKQLANGAGTNIYSTGTLQFPGGGLYKTTYSKMVTGHYVHIFNATTTNEAIASWVYGSIPTAPLNPSADFRTTIGFNVPTVYGGVSTYAPTYGSTTYGYPGITQADIFEPGNFYKVLKTIPTFSDNFTKIFGRHTIKAGGMASNTDNFQGNMGTNLQGSLTYSTGVGASNYFASLGTCGATCGTFTGNVGTYNTTAAFDVGFLSNYAESNSGPLQDLAFQSLEFYINDDVKVNRKLTVAIGFRIEHIGHWYDRQGVGIADFFPQRVLPDFYAGKVNPGFYWHGIDPSVPLSGSPDRFAYVSPRFGLSYDPFGNGKTLVRGGWGAYRFAEQYNDASNALTTAQTVKQFSASTVTSGKGFLLSQIGQLAPAGCQVQCPTTSTQYGFDANDYGIPITYSYNLTIDQKLPWKMLLDVAYVGNQAHKLSDTGASLTTGGQLNLSYANQNKTPLGAYFKPDPITGVISCNPENIGGPCSPLNNAADYQPFGKIQTANCAGVNVAPCVIYGANGLYQTEHIAYANYNGLQVALVKRQGPVTLNVNATWSKSLATINNFNPYNFRADYGYDTGERPFIFSSNYIYRSGNFFHGNHLVAGAINGWTISGISTWQQGANSLPGISIQYDPSTFVAGTTAPAGTSTGIGQATYYGTNAGITIRPNVTCNPKAALPYHKLYQPCVAPPAVGTYGGVALPYVAGEAYIDNDLALYKTFTVHDQNKVQFRISAFNWLNHPQPVFSGSAQTTEYYYVNYQTKAITANGAASGNPGLPYGTNYGILDYKSGPNSQRIMELDFKYSF